MFFIVPHGKLTRAQFCIFSREKSGYQLAYDGGLLLFLCTFTLCYISVNSCIFVTCLQPDPFGFDHFFTDCIYNSVFHHCNAMFSHIKHHMLKGFFPLCLTLIAHGPKVLRKICVGGCMYSCVAWPDCFKRPRVINVCDGWTVEQAGSFTALPWSPTLSITSCGRRLNGSTEANGRTTVHSSPGGAHGSGTGSSPGWSFAQVSRFTSTFGRWAAGYENWIAQQCHILLVTLSGTAL